MEISKSKTVRRAKIQETGGGNGESPVKGVGFYHLKYKETKKFLYPMLIIMLLLFSGCASTKGLKAPAVEETKKPVPTSVEETKTPAESPVDISPSPQARIEEMTLPEFKRPSPEKPLPKPEPIDPKRVVHAEGPVMLNTESMPLSDFIIYALGDTLKITFVIDEQVKNMKDPITLRMTREMPPESVLEIVIGLLERYDLLVEEKAGALYILKSRLPIKKPQDIRTGRDVPESPAEILQVVPLKYSRVLEIEGLIRDLYKTGLTIRVYHKENALLISGQASAIKEIMDFIEIFDVPYVQDKKAFILKLTYWQTDEFVKQVTQILEGVGFSVAKFPKDVGISFIPIKFLNAILVLAPDDASARYVLEWKDRLDTAESAGKEEKAFTYVPKYSKASDLFEALKNLHGVALPAPPAAPAAQAPGRPPAQPAPAQGLSVVTPELKIAADDRRNVLLILTTPAQYRSILSYLEKLDVPPRQVLIEATIAELTLRDDLRYGLEWYIKNKMVEGTYTLQTLGQLGLTTGTGLTFQFLSDTEKFKAVLNMFAQENKINILSSPRLMVIDNEEATIQIGTDIPILSGETQTTDVATGAVITTRAVQYRSTGVILRVKPTINTEGLVTLTIAQETSEAQTNILSAIESPMILIRRINSTVVAATGQSIILGGIMSENKSRTETKVPLFGDIPIFGNLFKTTSIGYIKTELIIMLTPSILTRTDEAVRVTNEFKEGLKWFK